MRSKIIEFGQHWALALIIGVVLGLNLVFWTQGDLLSLLLGAGVAAWDAFLLATVAFLCYNFGILRSFARLCLIAINTTVIALFFSLIFGYIVYVQDINAVKLYREPLVLSLEAYKNQYGHYPDKLSAIGALAKDRPRLTDDTVLYYNAGDRFFLTFSDPDPLVRFWLYDSAAKEWRITR